MNSTPRNTWKKSIRRISKRDLSSLLNKNGLDVLYDVNTTEFGFVKFLEEQRYNEEKDTSQILEMVVEILSRVCSIRLQSRLPTVDRFLRMLKNSQKCLFDDVPRLIYSCLTEKNNVDLVQLMSNYMNVLKVILSKDFFPFEKILNDIFPALENYMNRLRERKLANLNIAEESFMYLKRQVEKHECPENDEVDDDLGIKTFRRLSVVPRSNDIVNCEISFIPQNIIDKPYNSVDHYLSVHYRLMREDMLRTFRESINMHMSSRNRQQNSQSTNNFNDVTVSYPPEYSPRGIYYDIKCTTSKEIDWSKKEIFTPGTLVFLTPDEFRTVVFATIQKNPRAEMAKSKECRLKIKLEDDSYTDVLHKEERYKLVEPSAFFECYRHVLSAIKEFSEATLPLSDVLAYLDYSDPEPEYLHRLEKYCLHEECDKTDEPSVLNENGECPCTVFNPLKEEWPTSKDLGLDEQQYGAFKTALTKKVAVIQGPPGTGKTYIGVKVVKSLLRNVPHKPIVICCLTNHALDQFLERMLGFTKKIVRLGNQGLNEAIEPHKIENMMIAVRQYRQNDGIVHDTVKKPLALVKKIANVLLTIGGEVSEDEPELLEVKILSNEINRNLYLYTLCQDKYLEESALNEIIDMKYKKQLRTTSGSVEKTLPAGVMEWLACSRMSDLYDKCRKMFYETERKKMVCPSDFKNVWALTERKRFELFYCWRKTCLQILKNNIDRDTEEYKRLMRKSDFKKIDYDRMELLKGADIIGVTTTGACKYKSLMQLTEPRIMVVEEAAQVLEAHVIASLVRSIQHLILIGDHEQLRPLPANNDLSERYNLKISMFERLFNNDAPSATLVQQHRMKPCIAELLVPKPYAEYTSYENVYEYEEIKGLKSSVFFFDHREPEDKNSSGSSSSNNFEAKMVVALAKYFTLSLYPSDKVTILATYAAQLNLIRNYMEQEKLPEIFATTVDNFQGEENDIILLSFVRSNPSVIGFLKESNRVCVALSRAKRGMFCFGNFQLYSDKSELWKGIVEKLREKSMIGDALPLECYRHGTEHLVQSARNIIEFLSSGCSEECNAVLECRHKCTRKCHFIDPDHRHYLCKEPCTKMIDETRVCPRKCYERCKRSKKKSVELPCGHFSSRADSICVEEMPKRLPCTHLDTIPCNVDPEDYPCKASVIMHLDCGHKKSVWCYQLKEKKKFLCNDLQQQVAPCGHLVEVPCGMTFEDDQLLSFCNKACDVLLNCGHPCMRKCYLCFDTGIHGFCIEKCELVLSCGHKCGGYCGSPCPPCRQRCFLSCVHRTHCTNHCLRPCVECDKPCERRCKHGKCSNLCWKKCSIGPCMQPCTEKLPCGHKCIGFCGDSCPILCRYCHSDDLNDDDTGNNIYVQLECDHVVEANELEQHIMDCQISWEWPSCPRCSKCISWSVRYKEKLREAKVACITSYDTTKETAEIFYLVTAMYGHHMIVPARFSDIHKKIVDILTKENPRSDALMVLKNCVMLLKKLVIIAPELKKYESDEYIQGKFDTLILWIYNHLTQASFQQLTELEMAVIQLSDMVLSGSRLRLRNKYA